MSASKNEVREFLDNIESDQVAIGEDGRETGNYLEIGGHTPPYGDEEEQ